MNPQTAQHIVNKAITYFSALPPDLLLAYIQDLLRWNPQLGLVSRKDPLAAVERLVLESAELLTIVTGHGAGESARCLDVGSGGGFPGLVWALARPAWSFVLVERKVGRAAFLQAEVLRLSLSHVDVVAEPLERVARSTPNRTAFDVAVAMAVDTPARLASDVDLLLRTGGLFACTAPLDAETPGRVGISLDLEAQTTGDYGNFVLYRRRDPI